MKGPQVVDRETSPLEPLARPCYAPPSCLVKVMVTGKDTHSPSKLLKIEDVHELFALKGLTIVRSVAP